MNTEAHDCEIEIEEAGHDLSSWLNVGKVFTCPACGKRFTLHADESYDPETSEEHVWFILEPEEVEP